MVNTVGSYDNKYWTNKWAQIKRSLFLSRKQEELITGSMLGDGTMYVGKHAKNANFKVEHGLEQKEYVKWKYNILRNWVFTKPKLSYRYREENGEKYPKSWWFRTLRHPLLTEIHDKFYQRKSYRDRTKIVPKDLKENLTPLGLAVWIMDDGNYSRGKINISTYCFSASEIHFLQKLFRGIFGVKIKYYKDRDKGYRMYFKRQATKRVIKIISPFIIPSMKYKIGS